MMRLLWKGSTNREIAYWICKNVLANRCKYSYNYQESNPWLQESGAPHVIHRRQPVRPLHHKELLSGQPHFVLNQVLDIGN